MATANPIFSNLRELATIGERIDEAVAQFKDEGYLVIEDLIPLHVIAELRREYLKALGKTIERSGIKPVRPDERIMRNDGVLKAFRPEGGNHDLNRWNMHQPSERAFLSSRVFADPFVVGVLRALLGDDCVLVGLLSDTPLTNSGFQTVHQDDTRLQITMNVPLVDFTEHNGPTEIWPRTHRANPEQPTGGYTAGPYAIDAEEMKRRALLPSKRILLRAGSVLLRDHRLMHRGTPNRTKTPRPMLTFNYAPAPAAGMPHPRATDGVAALALSLREEGRTTSSPMAREITSAGWTLNRINEYSAGTDRDYRRQIPAKLWTELTPCAKQLLRFAAVEGDLNDRAGRSSPKATLRLSALVAKTYASLKLSKARGLVK